MRRLAVLAALLLVGSVAGAAPKDKKAGGKSAPACGAKILPLVVGNQWTYNATAAAVPATEQMAKLAPRQPKIIVVDVTGIEQKGADTVVSLSEKLTYDLAAEGAKPKLVERTVTSTITCNAKGKFDISPESFFFAGEPGGYVGMAFDKFERKKETSLKLTNGTIGENEWIEEIAAHWTQTPAADSGATLGSGKLEIERKFTPQEKESVSTKMGQYSAEKLAITTSGRVTLDAPRSATVAPAGAPPLPPAELPANWINVIWMVEDVGVVQTLNAYSHQYQLVDVQLK